LAVTSKLEIMKNEELYRGKETTTTKEEQWTDKRLLKGLNLELTRTDEWTRQDKGNPDGSEQSREAEMV